MEACTEHHFDVFPPFRSEIGSGFYISPISHPISELIHEATTSFLSLLSLLTLGWILALLELSYASPVEASDLFMLQNSCAVARVADKV